MKAGKSKLSSEQANRLIQTLEERFVKNMKYHPDLDWDKIKVKLEANPDKMWSINEMEKTGGEPDVIAYDKKSDEYVFCDCSAESPKDRRSFCYDRKALESRKSNKPVNDAMGMADAMGIEVLNEDQYRALQALGNFDTKTSSWIKTPDAIRNHGGAIFGDRRYDHVFIYHNGADSYYAARGFRGILKV